MPVSRVRPGAKVRVRIIPRGMPAEETRTIEAPSSARSSAAGAARHPPLRPAASAPPSNAQSEVTAPPSALQRKFAVALAERAGLSLREAHRCPRELLALGRAHRREEEGARRGARAHAAAHRSPPPPSVGVAIAWADAPPRRRRRGRSRRQCPWGNPHALSTTHPIPSQITLRIAYLREQPQGRRTCGARGRGAPSPARWCPRPTPRCPV